ncbi:MAG TPA: UDP-N-acetylmuramate--L-alanine ligase [Patescibacteria group bacterium]|nr:UDP-N-acetylmuramate--L-alanine ligase [Patescibacteria group bacterium]
MKKVKSVHFVGIKGVGMTPLAIIAKEAKLKVTGSDVAEKYITDEALGKLGIKPYENFSKEHINNVDLVITTGAHGGYDNIEVVAAKEKGIPVLAKGEAVGAFMDGVLFGRSYEGIAVAGSHGKTTTTAMIATILLKNHLDPSYTIGTGSVAALGALGLPGHFGKGKYFVVEADEYAIEPKYNKTAQFLALTPKIIVITNIELDHPDIYSTLDDVRKVFLQFAQKLPTDGILIANGDDKQVQQLKDEFKGKIITYGFSLTNDYSLERVSISGTQTFFWIVSHNTRIGELSIRVSGEHNALNALAASIVGFEVGLSYEAIKKTLQLYTGAKRRFEYKGTLATGAEVYDDYAHHPTEIQQSLAAFAKSFPRKKIVCVFQPHTYSRTKRLFDDFLDSFTSADTVILTDIYGSQRELPDPSISSKQMVAAMQKKHKSVLYQSTLSDVLEYLMKQRYMEDVVIITMGAGDIYTVGESLLKESK